MDYIIGQRWVSHADSELGLGIVIGLEERRVTLVFPAVGEERTYARENAPLTRLRFKHGDTLRTDAGEELRVLAVDEQHGLLVYRGQRADGHEQSVSELELDAFVRLTTPRQRLLNGQMDSHSDFALRVATCEHLDRLQRAPARGLLGARTNLLPHQVYIAAEVGQRHAPRVLLADEVGLGKTIEAGMILHQQLLTGRAQRVLVIVPAPLLHQWLVEMLRRFNLPFALFDSQRLAESAGNPFDTEQLVLCSSSLFLAEPGAREAALATDWDLVVIDEAHHLHWDAEAPGEDFLFVRALSERCAGLLLLTATPEQLGQESHFARLQLLDAARFPDYQRFVAEEARYAQWSTLIEALEQGADPGALPLPEGLSAGNDRELLIRQILDRHGTGRVLFRNTRDSVGGFPERVLHAHPLEPQVDTTPPRTEQAQDLNLALYPELAATQAEWVETDPRVAWLRETLRELRPQKALVICAHASTAIALEHYLHLRAGIRSAAFHEGLSIIERDRAAAYFADAQGGAQTLVCSEIGSEGRNFQFAQHLILFDLPLNPDLLEQRIGRLDRIGQRGTVHIHLPYLVGSAQETLFRWLHEGMDIFRRSCSAGQMIHERFAARLQQQLRAADADLDPLIADTRSFTEATREELRAGRDRILERNSCDPQRAAALIADIESLEDSTALGQYFSALCDAIGVEHEFHSEHSLVLRAGEHMQSGIMAELPEEGQTVTFDRDTALAREDISFISWEHPMVSEAMHSLLAGELGNAALGTLQLKGVAPGSLLLEVLFTAGSSAPRQLQVDRFLPLSPLRVLIDQQGRDLSAVMPHQRLNSLLERVGKGTAVAIVREVGAAVEATLAIAQTLATVQLEQRRAEAAAQAAEALGGEIERLLALQAVNPQVRDEEIDHLRWQQGQCLEHIGRAELQLQAVRLILTR